jgi:hypothetical protein
MEGRLFGASVHKLALCPEEGRLGEDCFHIDTSLLDPLSIGNVLRQWNGDRVEVEALPGNAGMLALKLRLLGRPPSRAFCPGYEGPLEPAAAEGYYDEAWKDSRFGAPMQNGTIAALHAYKAIAGFFPPDGSSYAAPKETTAFEIPQPFAGRDIIDFAAFSKHGFVFKLRDGRLHSWQNGRLQEVPERHGRILRLRPDGKGSVFYAVARSEDVSGRLLWNALRRLTPDLRIETLWESESHELTRFSFDGGGVLLSLTRLPRGHEIVVRQAPQSDERIAWPKGEGPTLE